jgi:hypothetical protein
MDPRLPEASTALGVLRKRLQDEEPLTLEEKEHLLNILESLEGMMYTVASLLEASDNEHRGTQTDPNR